MFHDAPKLRVYLLHLLGVVMVGLAFGLTFSAASTAMADVPCADEVEAADAEDPCETQCPGESPEGDCDEGCQHCGCCSSTAAFTLIPKSINTLASVPPSGELFAGTSSVAPSGVTHGVFKPPRHISA